MKKSPRKRKVKSTSRTTVKSPRKGQKKHVLSGLKGHKKPTISGFQIEQWKLLRILMIVISLSLIMFMLPTSVEKVYDGGYYIHDTLSTKIGIDKTLMELKLAQPVFTSGSTTWRDATHSDIGRQIRSFIGTEMTVVENEKKYSFNIDPRRVLVGVDNDFINMKRGTALVKCVLMLGSERYDALILYDIRYEESSGLIVVPEYGYIRNPELAISDDTNDKNGLPPYIVIKYDVNGNQFEVVRNEAGYISVDEERDEIYLLYSNAEVREA